MNANNRRGPGGIEALHIFALFSFALSQPLFDVLGRNPEYFVAHQTTPGDSWLLVLIVILLPPTVVVVGEQIIGRLSGAAARFAHLASICLLVTAILNPAAKRLPNSWNGLRILLALLAGLLAAWAYHRFRHWRTLITLLSPGILLFPAFFLYSSSLHEVLAGGRMGPPAAAAAPSGPSIESDVPVVMIILDELPVTSLMDEHHEIDATRFPAFASLAASATWYRNATTVADNTTFALPAILTGRYPVPGKIPIFDHYPDNLLTRFNRDYRLEIHEAATQLLPADWRPPSQARESVWQRRLRLVSDTLLIYLHIVMPLKVTNHLPDVDHTWQGFGPPGDWLHQKWIRALRSDRLRPWAQLTASADLGKRGNFAFLHTLLPHSPFEYLPSGLEYARDGGMPRLSKGVWETPDQIRTAWYRHLLQLAYVDRLLGRLLQRLEDTGRYDDCLIVLLADHGISFQLQEPPRPLSTGNAPDILSVPLFIKWPRQRQGVIDDRGAELIDIVPTLVDFLGFTDPPPMDGQSLLDPAFAEHRTKRIFKVDAQRWFTFPADPQSKYPSLEEKLAEFGSGAEADGMFYPRVHGKQLDALVAQIRRLLQSQRD